ncbi:MAG: hypothetical protein KTR31_32160 [Myxococcales bacterium]|nr:hypothetical protein [Myxococcales bacterium]
MATRTRTILRLAAGLGATLLLLVALGATAAVALGKSRPDTGHTGPKAEALADKLGDAVNLDAWEQTGAIRWTFLGGHAHLWDRQRGLSRVRWGKNEVLQRTDQRVGRAWVRGEEVHGEKRAKLVERAYAFFVNDSFWLQPLANLRDDDVTLSVVALDDQEALLVEYGSGGVTPGDAYAWLLDETGRPTHWRIWAQILPLKGLKASWEGWTTLPTGALISTKHRSLGVRFGPGDVAGARTLQELEPGADPFDALVNW